MTKRRENFQLPYGMKNLSLVMQSGTEEEVQDLINRINTPELKTELLIHLFSIDESITGYGLFKDFRPSRQLRYKILSEKGLITNIRKILLKKFLRIGASQEYSRWLILFSHLSEIDIRRLNITIE